MILVTRKPENRQLRHISMSIIRLENLLKTGSGGALEKIVQRAQNMGDLTSALRAVLPEEAQQQLIAANLRENGELVLICSSSSWAARLRFESEALIEAARITGADVSKCKVKVGARPNERAD
ncbi:MAG: DciA family protein [Woeseiaceae bacterium]